MPLTQKEKNKESIPDASHPETRKQRDQYGCCLSQKIENKDIVPDTSHQN